METSMIVGLAVAIYCGLPLLLGMLILCVTCKHDYPWLWIITHATITVLLPLAIIEPDLRIVFFSCAGLLYICKLLGWPSTKDAKALKNNRDTYKTVLFLKQLRDVVPQVSLKIECSHIIHIYTREETRKVPKITYSETRHIQLMGYFDQTASLLIKRQASLIYLELGQETGFLGQSETLLEQMCQQAHDENMNKDVDCVVTKQIIIPNLTKENYLKVSHVPCWIGRTWSLIMHILMLDVLYICLLRAKIPKICLNVKKMISLEKYNVHDQLLFGAPVFHLNVSNVQPPLKLVENDQPLLINEKQQQYLLSKVVSHPNANNTDQYQINMPAYLV